jgi:hypothetical protein
LFGHGKAVSEHKERLTGLIPCQPFSLQLGCRNSALGFENMPHFESRNNLIAFCVCVGSIVVLALGAAVICVMIDETKYLAQIVAALGFIGSAITGLVAIGGGFRFGSAKTTPLVDNSNNTEVAK